MRLSGIVVLVVEDDTDNRELLSAHLESEGALTIGAESIAAALELTAKQRADIALCDLSLVDGDGCELLGRLREREGWATLPAVALTGYSDEKWRKKAASCGFARYAVKPFSLEQITLWVAELGSAPT